MTQPTPPFPDDFLEQLEALVAIGAPTGKEERRADHLMTRLAEWGAGERVRRDALHNVWLDLSDGASECRLLDAHTDIVFDDDRPPLRKETGRWHAPGIADNTVSCALLLCVARERLRRGGAFPLIISFTAGEEGLGDLCGIKATVAEFQPRLKDAVILESGWGSLTCEGVGSLRHRIRITGPGGHSWAAFGTPSALHETARLIRRFEEWMPWQHGRHSFNVGSVTGGTTVNTIAANAEIVMDFRSTDPAVLARIERELGGILKDIESGAPGIRVTTEPIGNRPAGSLDRNHPLVREAAAALNAVGVEPDFVPSSTNANACQAAGIPSVCIRVAESGGTHTREEFLDLEKLPLAWEFLNRLTPLPNGL